MSKQFVRNSRLIRSVRPTGQMSIHTNSKIYTPLSSHSITNRNLPIQDKGMSVHYSTNSEPALASTSTSSNVPVTSVQHELVPGSCSMSEIMECVIKIFVTSSAPNYLQPWQTKPLVDSLGSGFIIKGRKILTNAHVVADAVQVMVRRPGNPKKFTARVLAAGHECDLALLEVDDPNFWSVEKDDGLVLQEEVTSEEWSNKVFAPDTHALIGENPAVAEFWKQTDFTKENGVLYLSRETPLLQDSVVVVGYPMGGDNLCITQGVVSRVEPVSYAHSGTYLLAIQIDAAINPGNSGGPALSNGRVVGVAFQNIQNASSVGYIIPTQVVLHFLRDVERGAYRILDKTATRAILQGKPGKFEGTKHVQSTGFCSAGFSCQDTSNEALQRFTGMDQRAIQSIIANTQLQEYTPNATPAAYLHYKQLKLHEAAPTDTGVEWKTSTVHIGEASNQNLHGVMILKVNNVSPCYNVLKRQDILLAVDDTPVANDGTVLYRGYERISLDYLFSLKHDQDTCKLTFLRKNANNIKQAYTLHHEEITMRPVPKLVPGHTYDQHPQFLLFGGLVYVCLSVPYFMEFGKDWYSNAPKDLVDLTAKPMLFESQQCVVLAQTLPDLITTGYSMIDVSLSKCDNVYIKNIKHLHQVIQRKVIKGMLVYEIQELIKSSANAEVLLNNINMPFAEQSKDEQTVTMFLAFLSELLTVRELDSSMTLQGTTQLDVDTRMNTAFLNICEKLNLECNLQALLSDANPYYNYLDNHNIQCQPLTYLKQEDARLLDTVSKQELDTTNNSNNTIVLPHLGDKNPYNTKSQIIYSLDKDCSTTPGTVITQVALEAVFGTIPTVNPELPLADQVGTMNTPNIVYELSDGRIIIIDLAEAAKRHEEIMIKHNIPCDMYLA